MQVLFTYHDGLRDDEMLIYYGMSHVLEMDRPRLRTSHGSTPGTVQI
jgi:hypothetical protein